MTESVYLLWDPRNGDIRYVGKTNNLRRVMGHQNICSANKPSHCASWKKEMHHAGVHCEYAIIEEGLTSQEASTKEIWWIAYGRKCGWPLTNLTAGGEGVTGLHHSKEHRVKISATRKSYRHSAETRAKISAALKGHPGHPISDEHRMKMNAARTGRPLSEEHRAKISAAQKAWVRRKQEAAHAEGTSA